MGEVLGFLTPILAVIAVILGILALTIPSRPRRGTYVAPPVDLPPDFVPPPMFHSRYCAGRYGSPCNCKGPHV